MNDATELPDIPAILGEIMQTLEPDDRPLMLALLERRAAERYRGWAEEVDDDAVSEGLLACAEREQEIAERVEGVFDDARATQSRLLSAHPELEELNRTLFADRPLRDQFIMQANGERAGGAAWAAFAEVLDDEKARAVLASCTPLEIANAEFLETLIEETDP